MGVIDAFCFLAREGRWSRSARLRSLDIVLDEATMLACDRQQWTLNPCNASLPCTATAGLHVVVSNCCSTRAAYHDGRIDVILEQDRSSPGDRHGWQDAMALASKPFYRADPARPHGRLGLSIVRRLATFRWRSNSGVVGGAPLRCCVSCFSPGLIRIQRKPRGGLVSTATAACVMPRRLPGRLLRMSQSRLSPPFPAANGFHAHRRHVVVPCAGGVL